jgi:hypothetical protein
LVCHTEEGTKIEVFENGVLRRIFGPTREEMEGPWRRLHEKGFMICAFHQIILGRSNGGGCDGRNIQQPWKR